MAGFALLIRSIDGIVLISDAEGSIDQTTGVYQINDNAVALIFLGLENVKKFCEESFKDIAHDDDVSKIIDTAKTAFEKSYENYKGTDFSFVIVSCPKPRVSFFYGLWIDRNGGLQSTEVLESHFFSKNHEDLIQYLVSKSYTKEMSLEELLNLSGFVTLQCMKIFSIGYDLDFFTVSPTKLKKLSDGEIKELIHKQEKLDNKLKKIFSDFFLDVGEKQ